MKIAVLMTVHNRKDKTLDCLRALFNNEIPNGFDLEVFLVDDGSSDGTGEFVKAEFSNVNIIQGNGQLYWNRGMIRAWQTAAKAKEYDFYLWLNDDTYLYSNAIEIMLQSWQEASALSIICGTICSPENPEQLTYGGYQIGRKPQAINLAKGRIELCDMINGNCVLVPKNVYLQVGNLDWTFRHAIGDHDYSLRAKKLGIPSYTTGLIVGTCPKNPSLPIWCKPDIGLIKRIKSLYSPLGNSQPWPYFIFMNRHFGLEAALSNIVSIHLRLLFPKFWVKS